MGYVNSLESNYLTFLAGAGFSCIKDSLIDLIEFNVHLGNCITSDIAQVETDMLDIVLLAENRSSLKPSCYLFYMCFSNFQVLNFNWCSTSYYFLMLFFFLWIININQYIWWNICPLHGLFCTWKGCFCPLAFDLWPKKTHSEVTFPSSHKVGFSQL